MARTVEQNRDMMNTPSTNGENCRRALRPPARAVSYHFAPFVAGFKRACFFLPCAANFRDTGWRPLLPRPGKGAGRHSVRDHPSIREDSVSRRATFLCLALFCLFLSVPAARSQQAKLDGLIDREMPSLLSTYKSLHAAPELSHHEEKTSAFVAGELRALGYTVTERIGKYAGHPEWVSYGVVGVLKNGERPDGVRSHRARRAARRGTNRTALREQSPDTR